MSRSTVNRSMLAAAGLLLLVAGLLVLAGGLDLYGKLHLSMPSWWPLTSPDQPVVSTASRTRWSGHVWWWPTVIAALSLAVAGAAWWLTAQLRRSGPSTVALPAPPGEGLRLRLRSRALEDAIETETVELPEVARVRVRLTGRRQRLLLRAAVRLEPGGAPADLLESFHAGPLAHARSSLALPDMPCELRLGLAHRHTAARKPPRVL